MIMKVFTAHNNTDKIFSTRKKAIDYIVIQWLMESDFYLDFKHEALRERAEKHVVENIVE
jgi:hypothetical protein